MAKKWWILFSCIAIAFSVGLFLFSVYHLASTEKIAFIVPCMFAGYSCYSASHLLFLSMTYDAD